MLIEGVTPRCGDAGYRRPNLGAVQTTGPISEGSASSWIPASGYRSVATPVKVAADAPGSAAVIPIAIDPSGAFVLPPEATGLMPPDVSAFVGEGGPTSSLLPPEKPAASSGGIPWLPLALLAGALFMGG
jgi:hypothetical protein